MDKLIRKFMMVVMLMFSTSTFAANLSTNAYSAPSSCQAIIKYGEKVAKNNNELKNGKLLMADLISCNIQVIPRSITADVLYSLFGSSTASSLSMVNQFVETLYPNKKFDELKISKSELDVYMTSRIKTFPELSATIEGFSFAVFHVLGGAIGVFMFFYLINTMSEGSYLGAAYNTFWTSTKNVVIFVLIMPLSGIGLNIIQLLMISLAFIGSFLASVIWSILPMFKYLYLTDFDDVDASAKTSMEIETEKLVSDLVLANVCDITLRQNILLNGEEVENYTSNIIKGKPFYTCLTKSAKPSFNYDTESIVFPTNTQTRDCAAIREVGQTISCGMLSVDKKNTELNKYVVSVAEKEARDIAKKIIGNACFEATQKNGVLSIKDGKPNLFYRYCANVDNISFGSSYKGKSIISTYPIKEYSKEQMLADTKTAASGVYSKLMDSIKTDILTDENIKNAINQKISYAINKGWLNAGTFMFDVGEATDMKNMKFEKNKKSVSYEVPPYNNNQYYTYQNYADRSDPRVALYNRLPIKAFIKTANTQTALIDIFLINEELKELSTAKTVVNYNNAIYNDVSTKAEKTTKSLNEYIFPNVAMIKEFNNSSNAADNTPCTSDYNNCKVMPVNPIVSVLNASRKAMHYSSMFTAISKYTENKTDAYIQKAQKEKLINKKYFLMVSLNLISSFVALMMGMQMIFSLIVGYLLPIILFIYFIGNAISWIVIVIFAVLAAPLWMALHLIPSRDKAFAGHGKKGYLMIMEVLLRPSFIVVGVFCSFISTVIMLVVLNTSFNIVLNTFSFFENPNSVTQLFNNFLINCIYLGFLAWVFFKAAKATYKIPNALQKWLGLVVNEDAGLWREITTLTEKTFLTGIKKYVVLLS